VFGRLGRTTPLAGWHERSPPLVTRVSLLDLLRADVHRRAGVDRQTEGAPLSPPQAPLDISLLLKSRTHIPPEVNSLLLRHFDLVTDDVGFFLVRMFVEI
jgi:hypothetical protein